DLRKPTQHTIHDLSRDRGLVHILQEVLPVHLVVQPTSIEKLEVVTAGPPVSNPAELLASSRLAEFLEAVRPDYDLILIDSAPILAVTDPAIVAATVDGIVLVTLLGQMRRREFEAVKELLQALRIPLLGVV